MKKIDLILTPFSFPSLALTAREGAENSAAGVNAARPILFAGPGNAAYDGDRRHFSREAVCKWYFFRLMAVKIKTGGFAVCSRHTIAGPPKTQGHSSNTLCYYPNQARRRMSLIQGVIMTFSKRMMFLTSLLLALFASALWVSCDLGTNSNGDDGNVLLSRNGSTVLPKVTGDEEGTYTGQVTVQMDKPIVFTLTLVLDGNGNFVYTSKSERGDADLEGTYTLSGGTLTLYDNEQFDKVYAYDGSKGTIYGDWYLGRAPTPVFRDATLKIVLVPPTLGSFIER
jgi:hypothetical protein